MCIFPCEVLELEKILYVGSENCILTSSFWSGHGRESLGLSLKSENGAGLILTSSSTSGRERESLGLSLQNENGAGLILTSSVRSGRERESLGLSLQSGNGAWTKEKLTGVCFHVLINRLPMLAAALII